VVDGTRDVREAGDAREAVPFSALDFHVLLVLAREPLYGYAIMQAVEEESGGRLKPEVGSLYRVLARLTRDGLVREEAAPQAGGEEVHPGRPRKYYGLTPRGRSAVAAEAARLREVLDLARESGVLPEGSP